MSAYSDFMEARGLVPPSRFETTVKLICTVASIFAVGWAGAWSALWLFPIMFVLVVVSEGMKRLYWKGFDPLIRRGASHGDFLRLLFWNGLTLVLDWFFCCLPPVVGACLLVAFVADKPVIPHFKWLFLWVCAFPPFMYPLQKGSLKLRLFPLMLRGLPAVPLALSFFFPVTGIWVLCVYALATIPALGISTYLRLPDWMQEFDKWYGAAHIDATSSSRQNGNSANSTVQSLTSNLQPLFNPRPGVFFEPRFGSSIGGFDAASTEMVRKTFTVLRVNWTGCVLSLSMLLAGAVLACIHASSIWLLLVPPCALFGLALGLGISDLDRKRRRDEPEIRFAPMLFLCALTGIAVLWLGGHEFNRLVAAGLLMTSSFMFFTGFIVRGSSEGVNDTIDLVSLLLGVAAMIVCRQCMGCLWWESLLPLVVSAGVPGYIRMCWPRRDLPIVSKMAPVLLDYQKEKQARRERKRERQIAAVRRSQRRG